MFFSSEVLGRVVALFGINPCIPLLYTPSSCCLLLLTVCNFGVQARWSGLLHDSTPKTPHNNPETIHCASLYIRFILSLGLV